jgi:hypothetical protein
MSSQHNYCTPNLHLLNHNTNEGSSTTCWTLSFQRTLLPQPLVQKGDEQLKTASSYKMLVPFYSTNIVVNLLAHLHRI